MTLTDESVLQTIEKLLPSGEGSLTYQRIADVVRCHVDTAVRSTRRLANAGRLTMEGGKGRRPVKYKVVKQ